MKLYNKMIQVITPLGITLLLSAGASADIFHLKDGTEIHGSINSETDDSYILMAEVVKNVFSEKTVLKSKVAEITKVDPSVDAFSKLRGILPTADMLEAQDYLDLIEFKVNPFMEKYPTSPHYTDAEAILTTLNNELQTVRSGGIKLKGKLLSPEQIEADKYNVRASILEHKFFKFSNQREYRAALSSLERLEDAYPDSPQLRSVQKSALIILPIYHEQLQKLHYEVDALIENRKLALDSYSVEERDRIMKIFAHEERQYQHLLQLANFNKKQAKWLPTNKFFKIPIANNIKMVSVETKRINVEAYKPSIDTGKYYRQTYAALEVGDFMLANENFEKFKKGKPLIDFMNELEPRIADAKIVMLQIEQQKKEEEARLKKLEAEEKARIAKEAKEAAKKALLEGEKKSKPGVANKIKDRHKNLEELKQ